jgi:MFS family permease
MISCALNGIGLALVIPCIQSLIADLSVSETRGRKFGMLGLSSTAGGMVGAFYATNISGYQPFGIQGWRFAFQFMAGLSIVTSVLLYLYAKDPREQDRGGDDSAMNRPSQQQQQQQQPSSSPSLEHAGLLSPPPTPSPIQRKTSGNNVNKKHLLFRLRSVVTSFKHHTLPILLIPSFQVLILQGIVGSMPWQAMAMFTLYFQLLGFTDLEASSLMAVFTLGCAVGGLAGGWLGDRVSRRVARGRIWVNQLSVFLGLPLTFILFQLLPINIHSTGTDNGGDPMSYQHQYVWTLYCIVLLIFGLSISWCGANNSAMFADLVPEEKITRIYAFDRSFEGGVAAMGAPLVGYTAERVFGFQGLMMVDKNNNGSVGTPGGNGMIGQDIVNNEEHQQYRDDQIRALGHALTTCLVGPWLFCFIAFGLLHLTYLKDRLGPERGMRRNSSYISLEMQGLRGSDCDAHSSLGPALADLRLRK